MGVTVAKSQTRPLKVLLYSHRHGTLYVIVDQVGVLQVWSGQSVVCYKSWLFGPMELRDIAGIEAKGKPTR